jgi:hypothetical protein
MELVEKLFIILIDGAAVLELFDVNSWVAHRYDLETPVTGCLDAEVKQPLGLTVDAMAPILYVSAATPATEAEERKKQYEVAYYGGKLVVLASALKTTVPLTCRSCPPRLNVNSVEVFATDHVSRPFF